MNIPINEQDDQRDNETHLLSSTKNKLLVGLWFCGCTAILLHMLLLLLLVMLLLLLLKLKLESVVIHRRLSHYPV